MADAPIVAFDKTLLVRDACLCLHMQRAARVLARRFDEALRPVGLTNEQFSLLMSLQRPEPPTMGDVASLLGADRTTLTGALKKLERRGLAKVSVDREDRRVRRIALTAKGRTCLAAAFPMWDEAHRALEAELARINPVKLRRDLRSVASMR
ncbi:MarR family winged helix-turn-helix transcriptional regulator [Roseiterribacter gracilis]|uniref:MarR family transcriptional regulator n=1 Tax=Roseiterribacter gracilis TaxID=2812848 RepID=A0A8S8XEE8_9PROT|nr:MarR family transcriptional regulator [Rhodospirillales bacterium TMPK1]